ncbi:peroxiredoxin family protein [Salinirubellus sp. GCM10025818]|uniref:peroxiredoxin family protein n=1 Tax=Salinirubellus TaxID=2162630 RepID=UPI0030D0796B
MPPEVGEAVPEFEALRCDGETFRPRTLSASLGEDGGVLVFFGFVFGAIAENWWKRYERYGWADLDVPVYGVGRDGPYSMNAFLREIDSPFSLFADVDGEVAGAFDLLTEREGMAGVHTSRRAVYVLDGDGVVRDRWLGEDYISPVPTRDLEGSIRELSG